MVVINLKVSEKNKFLHETTADCPIDKLIKDLVISKQMIINKYSKQFKSKS